MYLYMTIINIYVGKTLSKSVLHICIYYIYIHKPKHIERKRENL